MINLSTNVPVKNKKITILLKKSIRCFYILYFDKWQIEHNISLIEIRHWKVQRRNFVRISNKKNVKIKFYRVPSLSINL